MTEEMVLPELSPVKVNTPVLPPPAPVEAPTQPIVLRDGYVPKDQRKKILLLSDDLRMHSGVGVMSREMVHGTCHVFNWSQIAAAVHHPEMGKIVDCSDALRVESGVHDAYLRLYPYSGYGDHNALRQIIEIEKPDALMIFTDPRYFVWFFQMEHEIRKTMKIFYLDIWDDLPYPKYNRSYYRSCDALFAISKQTHNINRVVVGADNCVVLPNGN